MASNIHPRGCQKSHPLSCHRQVMEGLLFLRPQMHLGVLKLGFLTLTPTSLRLWAGCSGYNHCFCYQEVVVFMLITQVKSLQQAA